MSAPARCTDCSVELLPDSVFCHACGAALPSAAARLASAPGEHKRISVLFVDAFGSIGLGDRIDAEQWSDIVESFFSVVSIGVQHFGGTIDRLTGEGIKVLFGAPASLENHATQACHAALHIAARLAEFSASFRQRAGVDFSVRMGVNSGEVVFGRVGGGADASFTYQGHTAALAARMQQLAGPGQIYVTEHTAELVRDFFEMRAMGAVNVRNARAPVQVFELVRAREERSRLDVARERGLSPFVGRAGEMEELTRALEEAHGSHRRVIGIAGEPGIGKSRLVDEFVGAQQEKGLQVHFTRCLEHARWIPFHATLPFLRDTFGISEDSDAAHARDAVQNTLLAIDPGLALAVPIVFTVLGIAQPEETLRATSASAPTRELARVIRTLIEHRDAQRPSIFVVDDQQWMDPGSDAVFGDLVLDPPRSAALVLITYRHGHHRRWMRDPEYDEIALRPLSQLAMLELARHLLGTDRSLGDLHERVAQRAAGNPFFLEELVLALVATGAIAGERGAHRLEDSATELSLPASLHAVLAARVDQLTQLEKNVLQSAAVIGREFPVDLLAAIAGLEPADLAPALRRLETLDFVSGFGWGPRATYRFRHPLLRETVYRSLLRDRRERLHRDVVRALGAQADGNASAQAAMIAEHAEAAGDELAAARWHTRAARHFEGWDPMQSLAHWRSIVRCLEHVENTPEIDRLRLDACEAVVSLAAHEPLRAEEMATLTRDGLAIARRLGDVRVAALLTSAVARHSGASGDIDGAILANTEAYELARQSGDVETALQLGARLVMSERIAGRLRAARAHADQMLAANDPCRITAPRPGLAALRQLEIARAGTLLDLGELDHGAAELTRVIAALRRENAPMVLTWALTTTATQLRHTAALEPALVRRVEEAHSLAGHLGVPALRGRALLALAMVRICEGRFEEARDLGEEGGDVLRDLEQAFYVDFLPGLVQFHASFGCGDLARARVFAETGLAETVARGTLLGEIDVLLAYARLLGHSDDPDDRAQRHSFLRRGLALVRATRSRSREPLLWLELSADARRRGDARGAQARQRRALQQLIGMNATGHVRRAAEDLARARTGDGAPPP